MVIELNRMSCEMLWQQGGGEPPKKSLGWAIDQQFGSLESLIQKINAEGAALQGSGWVVSSLLLHTYNEYIFLFLLK